MKRSVHGFLAALILVAALCGGAPAVSGEESDAKRDRENEATEPAETSRNRAADAHREAVSQAANAVVSAIKLDLDIRLVGHTSVQVADER